ncbi:hypothetical protein CKG00_02100 [Morganella morganii]|uniref:Helix-turn-helix domain-containing protein n=1 Tax=Morganella morganii TaxID=582 RepID=A0A433ZT65_MORMO|nr:phage tail protein [Morganella morganii]RUT65324.1 hypothetical protein CKG00_02100 [Morganella morganii]
MSMILTARALQIKTGNALRKLVLVKLADNANDQGESWPSVPYIAEQCEMSERSVQNHINALVEMGLVRIEFRKSANGLNQSNIYHLRLNVAVVTGESPAPYGANPAGVSGANGSGSGAANSPGGATGSDSGAGAAPRISNDPVIDPDNKNIISRDEKTNVKTAMPESFEPGSEHTAKAEASGLDVQDEFQKFSDYHASKGTKWSLNFTGTESYILPIRDFIDRHGGISAFQWTPPLENTGLYRCDDPKLTLLGGDNYSLSLTFTQAFKP